MRASESRAQARQLALQALAEVHPQRLAAQVQSRPWMLNGLPDPEVLAELLGAAGFTALCGEVAFCPRVQADVRRAFLAHGAPECW